MKIKKDFIRVPFGQVDKDGGKLEPEQMYAERVMPVDAPITGQIDGQVKGTIRTEVVFGDSVSQFAEGIRRPCATCKFFDNERWRRDFHATEAGDDLVAKQNLNGMRAMLIGTQNADLQDMHTGQDGDIDVEHAMNMLGYCQVLTEMWHEPVIVHPLGVCPPEDKAGNKMPVLYRPNTKEQERMGSAAYDAVLNAAMSTQIK